MKASLEMSMYPLDAAYGHVIIEFLERLKSYPQLKVQTNSMSTQVFGTYDELHNIVGKEMKKTFEQEKAVVMVMKWVNLDLGSGD